MVCQGFDGELSTRPAFYNWQEGTKEVREAYTNLMDGILFDVEQNDLWFSSWGKRPTTLEERKDIVQELMMKAPKLIPVFGHRFLLAEPSRINNPVLSIMQSDIIIYQDTLRNYFIDEFLTPDFIVEEQSSQKDYEEYKKIPFWGEFLET